MLYAKAHAGKGLMPSDDLTWLCVGLTGGRPTSISNRLYKMMIIAPIGTGNIVS